MIVIFEAIVLKKYLNWKNKLRYLSLILGLDGYHHIVVKLILAFAVEFFGGQFYFIRVGALGQGNETLFAILLNNEFFFYVYPVIALAGNPVGDFRNHFVFNTHGFYHITIYISSMF
jgi:hypothetical protein